MRLSILLYCISPRPSHCTTLFRLAHDHKGGRVLTATFVFAAITDNSHEAIVRRTSSRERAHDTLIGRRQLSLTHRLPASYVRTVFYTPLRGAAARACCARSLRPLPVSSKRINVAPPPRPRPTIHMTPSGGSGCGSGVSLVAATRVERRLAPRLLPLLLLLPRSGRRAFRSEEASPRAHPCPSSRESGRFRRRQGRRGT